MKYFIDGDHVAFTKDDFINLQESPVVFYPIESRIATTVLKANDILALPLEDIRDIRDALERDERKWKEKYE